VLLSVSVVSVPDGEPDVIATSTASRPSFYNMNTPSGLDRLQGATIVKAVDVDRDGSVDVLAAVYVCRTHP
jgi:hypothetical protein